MDAFVEDEEYAGNDEGGRQSGCLVLGARTEVITITILIDITRPFF